MGGSSLSARSSSYSDKHPQSVAKLTHSLDNNEMSTRVVGAHQGTETSYSRIAHYKIIPRTSQWFKHRSYSAELVEIVRLSMYLLREVIFTHPIYSGSSTSALAEKPVMTKIHGRTSHA